MSSTENACPTPSDPEFKQPRILSRECPDTATRRFELAVPAELNWFDGHFPGAPVLPGVAQIGWAIRLAREAFALKADPARIERVKFQRPITPGNRLQLTLTRTEATRHSIIDWTFRRDNVIFSRGRFEFDA